MAAQHTPKEVAVTKWLTANTPKRLNKGSFEITLGKGATETVDGWLCGCFGLHHGTAPNGWRTTHLGTGYQVGQGFDERSHAAKLATLLDAVYVWNWDSLDRHLAEFNEADYKEAAAFGVAARMWLQGRGPVNPVHTHLVACGLISKPRPKPLRRGLATSPQKK